MTAQRLLEALHGAGVELRLDGGRLRYRAPPGALTPDLRAAAAEHRDMLVELLTAEARGGLPAWTAAWPEPWATELEERAAIMEFDGGLPRPVAELEAEVCVRHEHARCADDPCAEGVSTA